MTHITDMYVHDFHNVRRASDLCDHEKTTQRIIIYSYTVVVLKPLTDLLMSHLTLCSLFIRLSGAVYYVITGNSTCRYMCFTKDSRSVILTLMVTVNFKKLVGKTFMVY